MLHAVIHRKTHIHRAGEERHTTEDIITSAIFGPLRYLPPDEAWHMLESLFAPAIARWPKADKIDSLRLDFWPHKSSPLKDYYVEPDLVASVRSEGKVTARLVIEVKWGADLDNE